MKTRTSAALATLAIVALMAAPVLAEEKAESKRLIIVHEVTVNPERVADHEALIKDFLAEAPTHQHALPFSTFTLEDSRFFYATALSGYSDLESFQAAWNDTMAKMGPEKLAEFMAKGEGVAQFSHDSLWWERMDLSYVPEDETADPTSIPFRFWGWIYGQPGHEKQIEEIFKQYVDLYQKHEISRAFYSYSGDIGTDAPVYVWSEMAESEAAFTAMNEQIMKKVGDEGMTLWTELLQHTRRYEFMRGMHRPELSYTPKTAE